MNPEILGLIYIFCARICDVSIGTMRIILITRGYKNIAPILGFFEVLIWLTAISKAIQNLNSIYSYLIYAAGFACGNYVGMLLEQKIAIGFQEVRIITSKMVSALPLMLAEEGFRIAMVDGRGAKGKISIVYTVVPKKAVARVLEIVKILEPNSFITIEDVKSYHYISGDITKKNFFEMFGRGIAKKT